MTSSVIVTIQYQVKGEKLGEFQGLIAGVIGAINSGSSGVRASIYKDENEKNSYLEIYECDSIDGYDNLEDALDDATRSNIAKIASEFTTSRQSVTTYRKAG